MAFKLGTKAAAASASASPAAALRGGLARGSQGTSRVAFGPAASRNKALRLRTANYSAMPMEGTSRVAFGPAASRTKGLRLHAASNSETPMAKEERVDQSATFELDSIRKVLIRLEDSIIFGLLERAQYCYNTETYDSKASHVDGFDGSLVEYMVKESEKLHAQLGRFNSPDEYPFFPEDLPEPRLPPLQYPKVLHPAADSININKEIWKIYFDELLPRLVKEGSDGNAGHCAVCDTTCLQALSKRIHYGMFVAESKFQESPEDYKRAIVAQDRDQLMHLLTYPKVERSVEHRVEAKAKVFEQEVNIGAEDSVNTGWKPKPKPRSSSVLWNTGWKPKPRPKPKLRTVINSCTFSHNPAAYKMRPSLVAELYSYRIMPLTKEVEVAYLLKRLD